MPVVTELGKIYRPEQLIPHFEEMIKGSDLPFDYVAKYEERLTPRYPAVQLQPGVFDEEPHATHTRLITLRAFIYVMHGKLTLDYRTRSEEDLILATRLKYFLEEDVTLGGRIIHGFVDSETPAAFPPRARKGDAIVGTRMTWTGAQQIRWR